MEETKNFFSPYVKPYADYLTKIKSEPKFAAHEFEKNLVYAKCIFFVLIIIMVIVNFDTDFIKKKPKEHGGPGTFFAYETLLFAFCGAFGFTFIKVMRHNYASNLEIAKSFGIFFAVFAILNVLLQLSGVLTIALPKEKDAVKDEELVKQIEELEKAKTREYKDKQGAVKSLMIFIGLVFLLLIIVMIGIALSLRDTTVQGYGNIWTSWKYWLEAFVFAAAASFNFFASARWRTGKVDWSADSVEVGLLFVKFFILHNLLQLSGVYNHILFAPIGTTTH